MKKYRFPYVERICPDCFNYLTQNEQDHPREPEVLANLALWRATGYVPIGTTDNDEPDFVWTACPLCGELPGSRYEYTFLQQ